MLKQLMYTKSLSTDYQQVALPQPTNEETKRETPRIEPILKRAHTLQMDDHGCLVLLSDRPAR